ncbi:hypothetical protein, partial [Bacillus cereus group sp. RP43]|uniref:hypothetical protein n=1 Tax=Bacillus cereus group sp. RP43 TaxID=3040260 RepID=UPI003390FA36
MPISLSKIGNNGFGLQYKTEQNQNLTTLESAFNNLEQKNGQVVSDAASAQKQLDQITIKSKNIFDKNDVSIGYYIDGNTGNIFLADGYFASNFIKISPNIQYAIAKIAGDTRIAFYDVNKIYLSRATDGSTTFTTPGNSVYIRIGSRSGLRDVTQIESGSIPTGYEPFGSKVNTSSIPSKTMEGEVLKDKSIAPEKIKGVKFGKNIFNKNTVIKGKFVIFSTGLLADNSSYFSSDYISVDPNVEYVRSVIDQMAFYTSEKVYISGKTYTDPANFTTPDNCAYVRVCAPLTKLNTYQVEKGSVSTSYEDYGFEIDSLKAPIAGVKNKIYTLNDAWVEWLKGNKFPIAFYGDSTVDGANTSGFTLNTLGVDSTNINAFPKKLEELLRDATKNTILRVYNAGYSGQKSDWGLTNINTAFGGASAYNDVKMIGIGFGIN